MSMFLPAPRGLRSPQAVEERHELWRTSSRAELLRDWVQRFQATVGALVPLPDPADGGDRSRVLVLLEAPGPATNPREERPGSGFISIDNDDGTAANTWELRRQAGLTSGLALHWNIVPRYLGRASVKPRAADLADGARALREVAELLTELEVVVLCGRYAQRGWQRHLSDLGERFPVLSTWHPSPLALTRPERRDHILHTFRQARALVSDRD